MRVIITGGAGFIGRVLADRLAATGREVVVLTRRPGATDRPGVTHAVWDGRSGVDFAHLAEGAEAIVNLAGENIASGLWTTERKERIRRSRLSAGEAVVAAAAACRVKPKTLVQASAVGYYGSRGDEILDESSPPGGGFLAETAVLWEASTKPVEDMGTRRVIVRTGVVLGRGGGVLERMAPPFRFFVGGPLGNGRQYFPWVHLADEVGAMLHLLDDAGAEGPYNLVAPGIVDANGFAAALGKALGRPAAIRVPATVLRLLLAEMADELLLSSTRAAPGRLIRSGYRFLFPSLPEALADILS